MSAHSVVPQLYNSYLVTVKPDTVVHSKTMKLAITGCNGSVGSRVALAALKQGHTVVGIDSTPLPDVLKNLSEDQRGRFTFREADLRDYTVATNLLRGCEGIVHLAAMRTPGDYHVATHNT